MRQLILIWTVFLALTAFTASKSVKQHIITTDGVDGIKVGQTTLKEVQNIFPSGKLYQSTTDGKKVPTSVKWANGTSSTVQMYRPKKTTTYYKDEKEGIEFYFAYTDTVSNITIWGKNFSTDRGIIIGKSTFHDIDSIYGTKEWFYENSQHGKGISWSKCFKNITFLSADTTKVLRSDNLVVDHIYITNFGLTAEK